MKSIKFISILIICTLTGCIGGGTLGGFDMWTFPTSKKVLVSAIDTLFAKHPEYAVPSKWKSRDDWKSRGYDFLDSRIFYFKTSPEEMYYVSFYGDANDTIQINPNETGISIRAVDNGTTGWTLEKDTKSSEEERIEDRFAHEIIAKLELYTGTKTKREE